MDLHAVKRWTSVQIGEHRLRLDWLIAEVERLTAENADLREGNQSPPTLSAPLIRERERLLDAVKLAYRKHHMDDSAIGWEELDTKLLDVLCFVMGDGNLCKWLESVTVCEPSREAGARGYAVGGNREMEERCRGCVCKFCQNRPIRCNMCEPCRGAVLSCRSAK